VTPLSFFSGCIDITKLHHNRPVGVSIVIEGLVLIDRRLRNSNSTTRTYSTVLTWQIVNNPAYITDGKITAYT